MKKINIFLLLLIVVLLTFSFSINVNGQWEPDVRLTNDPATSWTSYNNAWCIASSGNAVHVVWYDVRNGNFNFEIYYKRSTDAGASWETDTRLTNNTAYSLFPSVTVSGSVVHVVWVDQRDGNEEIYYKRSTDAGVSWGADTRLTKNTDHSEFPSVTVSGSVVYVVWEDASDGLGIYYKRSTDAGVNWGAVTQLTRSPISEFPSVTVSGSVVHVVWHDRRDWNKEIYYKRSTDAGVNWGTDTRLTNNPYDSYYPSVTVSGSVVHVVWVDKRDGNDEIYYKRSTDAGVNWGTDTRLTNDTALSVLPSVTVFGSVVHVVWEDKRDGNWEIYYKRSTDGGVSWEAYTQLTNNTASSARPSVTVSGSVVHVVWLDNRDGNYEIYYKRDTTGNLVEIKNISSELPKKFLLYQNYPNPFNPTTKIKFDIPQSVILSGTKNPFILLKVFDVLGNEVSTIVNEQLKPGTYEVEFDGSNFASGVYYYKLLTDEYTETKRMVLLK